MGFRPSLKRTSLGISAEAAFLASEHMMVKRVGVTLDATTVGADANGNKILRAGTVLGKITANGKHRAYSNVAGDGSQTAVGFLLESENLRDGDVICGMIVHGSVLEARTSGVDAAAKTDLQGLFVFQ